MSKALSKTPAKPTTATAPFGSVQGVDLKKLEQTIEQMYFQGKNVSPEQKAVFVHAVNRTGLDPIVEQIRPVLRRDNRSGKDIMAIPTSIDGYRLIADRTGLYAGSDDPTYEPPYDANVRTPKPDKATVTVWKYVQGQKCSFTASARWMEYCPLDERSAFMWKKMPYLMLAKCAEALALRKAFPADLSGVYTDDEMQQADVAKQEREEPKAVDVNVEPAKHVPTKDEILEHLGKCRFFQPLQVCYDAAMKYEWSAEDLRAINDQLLQVYARNSGTRQEAMAFFDQGNRIIATIKPAENGRIKIEPHLDADVVETSDEKDAEAKTTPATPEEAAAIMSPEAPAG